LRTHVGQLVHELLILSPQDLEAFESVMHAAPSGAWNKAAVTYGTRSHQ
jgi:hypothetical protein